MRVITVFHLVGLIISLAAISSVKSQEDELASTILVHNKSLIEFMEAGKVYISTSNTIRDRALMVMGLSGVGKSTLINYLSKVPLVCMKRDGKWIVDLKYPDKTLPGGFSIGHKTTAQTIYPASYSDENKDFSFIDNPGFRETRGLGYEISCSFFRKEITEKVTELKFLLLVPHDDLNDRGYKFRESIKGFSEFLGAFEDEDEATLLKLSKSIGIIVTKVDNDGESDADMVEYFKSRLSAILDEQVRTQMCSRGEETVFKRIISNGQIKIFSNPRRKTDLSDDQRLDILQLLDDLDYISKADAKIRAIVHQEYAPMLLNYTKSSLKRFETYLNQKLKSNIDQKYFQHDNRGKELEEITSLLAWLLRVESFQKLTTSLEEYLTLFNDSLISVNEREDILSRKKILDFFFSTLPSESKGDISFDRYWINDNLAAFIQEKTSVLMAELEEHGSLAQTVFQRNLTNLLSVDCLVRVNQRRPINEFASMHRQLAELRRMLLTRTELKAIVESIYQLLKNRHHKTELLSRIDAFERTLLPFHNSERAELTLNKIWINTELNMWLNKLFEQLTDNFKQIFSIFSENARITLEKLVDDFYSSNVNRNQTNSLEDLKDLTNKSNQLKELCKKSNNFTEFVGDLEQLFNQSVAQKLESNLAAFEDFLSLLTEDQKKAFTFDDVLTKLSAHTQKLEREFANFENVTCHEFRTEISCRGLFIKVSQVLSVINRTTQTWLKSVEIFALKTVVFDVDYLISVDRYKYSLNSPDLIVIAPRVIFEKAVKIDLSCYQPQTKYPDYKIKAESATVSNTDWFHYWQRKDLDEDGKDGKAGLPGGNGGNMLLLAGQIINRGNMNFISTGGQGGPGQNGGDGKNGDDSRDASYSDLNNCNAKIDGYGNIDYGCDLQGNAKVDDVEKSYGWFGDERILKVRFVALHEPGKGGSNGRPGPGGMGGLGGECTVIETVKSNQTTIQSPNGKVGASGLSGSVGLGGRYGWAAYRLHEIVYKKTSLLVKILTLGFASDYKEDRNVKAEWKIPSNKRGADGTFKPDGSSSTDRIGPDRDQVNYYYNYTNYLTFLLQASQKHANLKLDDDRFYRDIVQVKYGWLCFGCEVEDIADRCKRLIRYESSSLLPALNNVLVSQIEAQKLSNSNKENDILMNYLSAALKSVEFRNNSTSVFGVDVTTYAGLNFSDIKNWDSLKMYNVRDLYRREYEGKLKDNIKQAYELISKLEDDVEENQFILQEKMRNVLEEIDGLKARPNAERLLKMREIIKEYIVMKKRLSILNISSDLLFLLRPEGAVLGSVFNNSLNLAEYTSKRIESLFSIANIGKFYLNHRASKAEIQEKLKILEIKEGIDQEFNETTSFEARIDNLPISTQKYQLKFMLAQYLANQTSNNTDVSKYKQVYESRFKFEMWAHSERMNKSSHIGRNSLAFKQAELVHELKLDSKEQEQEIQIVNDEIQADAANYDKLYDIELLLSEFKMNDLFKALGRIDKLSSNFKNKIFDFLGDYKEKTKEILDSVRNDLANQPEDGSIVKRIENILITIINTFGHVQEYSQQNELANVIADIQRDESVTYISYKHTSTIAELRTIILEGLITNRYQKALQAFKFWSFPFFCEYNERFNVVPDPNTTECRDNLERCVSIYVEKMMKMLEIMHTKSSELKIDNHIVKFAFDSDQLPFYKWSSLRYKHEIESLLRGSQVTLFSDVKDSPFDAIKFRNLYLHVEIKASNASTNHRLNMILLRSNINISFSGLSSFVFKENYYSFDFNSSARPSIVHRYGQEKVDRIKNEELDRLETNNWVQQSPYSLLSLKIEPVEGEERRQFFDEIAGLIEESEPSEIILYLIGDGEYVANSYKVHKSSCLV